MSQMMTGPSIERVTPNVRPAECKADVATIGQLAVAGITAGGFRSLVLRNFEPQGAASVQANECGVLSVVRIGGRVSPGNAAWAELPDGPQQPLPNL